VKAWPVMNTTVAKFPVWQRWKEARQLVLLAAFEDSVTCTRVKEFCQGLTRDLGAECKIIQHVWLFNTFRMRELQEIAAEEAAVADLIVVAAHHAASLPDEVKGWIDLWLRQKGTHPAVLLALLDPVYEGTSSAIRSYLREVARRGQMEFLADSEELLGLASPGTR
jgi:hypothetical protein